MDWFLYDNGLRHERVKKSLWTTASVSNDINFSLIFSGKLFLKYSLVNLRAGIYFIKVNHGTIRTIYEILLKLTIHFIGVILVSLPLTLTLNKQLLTGILQFWNISYFKKYAMTWFSTLRAFESALNMQL